MERSQGRVQSRKHGIDFADAVGLFDDPFAFSMPDDHRDEPRFLGLGSDSLGRIIVVVYMYRGDRIRIISARRATPSERKLYEAAI